MTHKPLISIGVPVKNGGCELRTALDSLVNQTYRNIEIIISNNNSSDETGTICREFSNKDNRIKLYEQGKDLNVIENLQLVFEKSNGD